MKRRTKIALAAAAAVFLALFATRLVYELGRSRDVRYPQRVAFEEAAQSLSAGNQAPSKRNYASAKIAIAQPSAPAQLMEQKYEQVASLASSTSDFEGDAQRIRSAARAAGAVVQREDSYGLPGSRSLSLGLGVVPASFDATIEALREIGKLESISVNKADRTADYRALEARRLSLEKTRDGLAALRRAGSALADLVALETKILEIEGQIQELGVSLGDFSEGSSLCTVNVFLRERAAGPDGREILRAVLESLGWAATRTCAIAIACLAATGAAWLGAMAVSKYRGREKRPD